MSTVVSKYDNVAVLTVKDDLAGEALELFNEEAVKCTAQGFHELVIDCGAVGGFDSAGLEMLVELQNQCEEQFGSVKLCGLDETLTKILEITRLTRRFEIFPDLDSAVRSFS